MYACSCGRSGWVTGASTVVALLRADREDSHCAPGGDALREERRRQRRLPGRGRGPARPRVRAGVGVAHRVPLAGAGRRGVPAPARLVLATDPLRQARHGPVRPRAEQRAADARAADGRRASRHGRGRIGAGRIARPLRGRPDVPALRRDVSGANDRRDPHRRLREADLGSRLPVRDAARAVRGVPRARSRAAGAGPWASLRGLRARPTIPRSAPGGRPISA